MDEAGARAVTLLQAFETAEPPAAKWSDADRAWATRAARDEAAVAGRPRSAMAIIERRARLALPRLAAREAGVGRHASPPNLRVGWLGAGLVLPFAAGLAADALGSGQRINLLAPPLAGVLVWNLVVYLALIAATLARATPAARSGPIRRRLRSLFEALTGAAVPRDAAPASRPAWRVFAALWFARSAPLASARAGAWLHAAAAVFACGLVTGLYLRGLVLDFRAGWESTFLTADAVHALLGAVLAPAQALTGIPLPDAAGFAAMRAPSAGAPAAPWIHLLAATLALFVILPRLLLALVDAGLASWRAWRFMLLLAGEPYFERLARELQGEVAQVVVVPFATRPEPVSLAGVEAALGAALGVAPRFDLELPAGYAAETASWPSIASTTTHVLAWFDLAATPETEVHGRFLAALAAASPPGAATLLVVEAAAFSRRFAHAPSRIDERCAAWHAFAAAHARVAVIVGLGQGGVSFEAALRAPVTR